VRGLLLLVAFEGFRLARSGRAALVAVLRATGARSHSDLAALLGALAVVLAAMFETTWPYTAVLLGFVVLCVDPWAVPADDRSANSTRPPRPLRSVFGRMLLPVLIAISAWVMPLYTRSWGWFGVVASSLVLALAVVGYLQQSLPDILRDELRTASPGARFVRSLAAFVVLSIGALSVGASLFGPGHGRVQPAAEPSSARIAQLAGLVAANAREVVDPLWSLPQRVRGCQLQTRVLDPGGPAAGIESEPNTDDGVMLILAAPLLLVWSRRWGWTWLGCWRYAFEVLAVVLLGLLGSMPVGAVLLAHGTLAEFEPLVVQASLPQGMGKTRANLELALGAEGFASTALATRTLGDSAGSAMEIDSLAATLGPVLGRFSSWPTPAASRDPVLAIEIAGDSGHWASAISIEVGPVSAIQRTQWRALLTRIIKATHAN
jgi:hypothetical protein